MREYLSALFEHGCVRVPPIRNLTESDYRDADELLQAFDEAYRQEMPGSPPPLCLASARWAAVQLFRACQYLIFRDVNAATVSAELSKPCPVDGRGAPHVSPAVHYSVDLTFRFLPDLMRLARAAAQNDVLVAQIAEWARAWPLSSVGMADNGSVNMEGIVQHPGLLAMYVDRVLARRDRSRMTDERVLAEMRRAVGPFDRLARGLDGVLSGC